MKKTISIKKVMIDHRLLMKISNMEELHLKEDIYIKGFASQHECVKAAMKVELLFIGSPNKIPKNIGEEYFDRIFGESEIRDIPIYTYKDYAGLISRLYPRMECIVSSKTMYEIWNNNGCKTTKYFHTLENSIKSACNEKYCIIYRK